MDWAASLPTKRKEKMDEWIMWRPKRGLKTILTCSTKTPSSCIGNVWTNLAKHTWKLASSFFLMTSWWWCSSWCSGWCWLNRWCGIWSGLWRWCSIGLSLWRRRSSIGCCLRSGISGRRLRITTTRCRIWTTTIETLLLRCWWVSSITLVCVLTWWSSRWWRWWSSSSRSLRDVNISQWLVAKTMNTNAYVSFFWT